MMKTFKIAIIGGGSSYTPELVDGLIQRIDQLPVTELALADVELGRQKVEIIAALTRRMLDRHGLEHVKVSVHFSLDDAITGASFVLTQFRVGQLPARAADERLGLKYNLLGQETTGVGGFAKALRTIPVMLDIAARVERLAPDAWIINFTNPAGIVTEAVTRYSKAKIIGLCNVPISMHHMIANLLHAPYEDIQLRFAGLNHMVWVHEVLQRGKDVTAEVLNMLCDGASLTMNNIKEAPWPPEFLRAMGAIPCPYHRYFYQTQDMLAEEIAAAAERGTRAEQVMQVEKELFELYADPHLDSKPEQLSFRGGSFYSEVALELIRAIHNNLGTQLVVNTTNRGAIRGLSDGSVVETNCIVDAQGAHPLTFGPLPVAMHGLTQQVKAYERLTIEAAVHGDRRSALLALVTNPLIANASIAQPLLEEVLQVNKPYLPQFTDL
ncbi:putative glycosyl hydrolase [Yersinia intermedia]|uniref:Putative glycosyl hydrolase n=2 Tax=Yersinia intermedia TaxID=631 RepID=A0A0T9MB76_YERIN|nr:putative glycosyl hydrolase [Yersinia intermedia]CNF90006.1 putative glycosyl hydrolase [Yersinia intermedia]CNI55508.1 putative glycosyl hydrolase [Yersinia intermedia]CRE75407.1 putative glycosyl hydrolase [Yersinia intermedia]